MLYARVQSKQEKQKNANMQIQSFCSEKEMRKSVLNALKPDNQRKCLNRVEK